MLHPTIFNTSEYCHKLGVNHIVLSPGSRNAPLTISFARNKQIKKWVVPDERAAGFIALGIAQKTGEPTAICCTSGTALLNYAPAVAEAYYREIPLIVFSADRPTNLIDQRDGQTIRQFEALKNHVKDSVQLPEIQTKENQDAYSDQLINAIRKASHLPQGPVHLNIPFSEPFYPTDNQLLKFDDLNLKRDNIQLSDDDFDPISLENKKVLILVGQMDSDEELDYELSRIESEVPIIASPLSNTSCDVISKVDLFLSDQEYLKPDILLSTGYSVLSKKLKNYIRKHKTELHLHFDPAGVDVDTYQTKPKIIRARLSKYLQKTSFAESNSDYRAKWKSLLQSSSLALDEFMRNAEFSEAKAFYNILNSVPNNIDIHLSNSMPVRFADMFGVKAGGSVWSNRGTSGIDGCTSTALGTSLVSDNINLLLTGDLAFLYDRNAFFHNYAFPNLRIIVFNNHGGGIFRLIEGPSSQPELEEYFETRHNRTAKYICEENKIEYRTAIDENQVKSGLVEFFTKSDTPKLLEIFTDPEINEKVFKALKIHVQDAINY